MSAAPGVVVGTSPSAGSTSSGKSTAAPPAFSKSTSASSSSSSTTVNAVTLNGLIEHKQVDFLFRCNHCVKLIPESAPIYMRNDSSYCSTVCRKKGISPLYTNLVDQQLKLMQNDLQDHVPLTKITSESSVQSRSDSQGEEPGDGILPFRLVAKLGQKILDKIIPVVKDNAAADRMLRTYSSGLVWGKEYTRNSSFNFLFHYFPNIDQYYPQDSSLHRENTEIRLQLQQQGQDALILQQQAGKASNGDSGPGGGEQGEREGGLTSVVATDPQAAFQSELAERLKQDIGGDSTPEKMESSPMESSSSPEAGAERDKQCSSSFRSSEGAAEKSTPSPKGGATTIKVVAAAAPEADPTLEEGSSTMTDQDRVVHSRAEKIAYMIGVVPQAGTEDENSSYGTRAGTVGAASSAGSTGPGPGELNPIREEHEEQEEGVYNLHSVSSRPGSCAGGVERGASGASNHSGQAPYARIVGINPSQTERLLREENDGEET
ncbi:unnamed protein product [Amoebophrya sp. A25]|nr:unnamed protein product [Amoebophrya sp. A25]|eukprot:GSA25T00023234001.1